MFGYWCLMIWKRALEIETTCFKLKSITHQLTVYICSLEGCHGLPSSFTKCSSSLSKSLIHPLEQYRRITFRSCLNLPIVTKLRHQKISYLQFPGKHNKNARKIGVPERSYCLPRAEKHGRCAIFLFLFSFFGLLLFPSHEIFVCSRALFLEVGLGHFG